MKPSVAPQAHRIKIRGIEIRRIVEVDCGKNARVFGFVAVGEDAEGSGLDLLVDQTPEMTLSTSARAAINRARCSAARWTC